VNAPSSAALAAALALGCARAAVPPVGMPSAGEPGATDDGLPIVQVAYAPGELPLVPRLHRHPPGTRAPSHDPPASDGADVAPRAETTRIVVEGPRLGHDPGVAAGDRYLMVYTAHTYQLLDKETGRPLPAEADDEVPVASDFNTLFSPLWAPRDKRGEPNAESVNHRLRMAPGDPLPCDPADPLGPGSPACIREFYDSRAVWDPARRRFWIESAVRNHLWFCTPSPTEPCTDPKWSKTQPRRFIAVAVSRTEDPRKGWHRYVLVDEYADWPKMAVSDRYLVLSHMTSPNVYVFDADRLAAGNPGRGPVRLAKLDAASFPGARFINPVTHHGPTGDVTFLVGTDGSERLSLFGLVPPARGSSPEPTVIAGPRLAVGHPLGTFLNNGVYRDGRMYLTWDECTPGYDECGPRRIRVLRVPVRRDGVTMGTSPPNPGGAALLASTSAAEGFLDAVIGGREPDDPPDTVADYVKPVLDVAVGGDVVVAFARRGFRTTSPLPFELRYSLLNHGEAAPRPSVLVRRGTWAEAPDIDDNGKAGIDLAGAQTDPADDRTVWFSHAVADRSFRWFRQVTAAVRPEAGR
jgi:hypothetical protein